MAIQSSIATRYTRQKLSKKIENISILKGFKVRTLKNTQSCESSTKESQEKRK
jgi:hypothetical protein